MIRHGPAATTRRMAPPDALLAKTRPPAFTAHAVRMSDGAATCFVVLSAEGARTYRRRGTVGLREAAGSWLEEIAGAGAALRVAEELATDGLSSRRRPREPKIVAMELHGAELTAIVDVPHDLAIFAGHFPHIPIVPGAILVGWALDLAARNDLWPHRDLHAHSVKFRRIVQPGDRVRFVITTNATASRLAFRIESDAGLRAAGTLLAPPS
jgi:hypothetical protein